MMNEVEEALYFLLVHDASLSAFVGNRVYPLVAPNYVETPYIAYKRVSGPRWRSISGPSGVAQPRIQIDVYDLTYAGAKATAKAVRKALDGYRGVIGGIVIGGITVSSDHDMIEDTVSPMLYRVNIDIIVTHQEG